MSAALTAMLGVAFLIFPFGEKLVQLSYDLAFYFRGDRPVDEVVIIYMDEHSEERLGQGRWERWDRALHARLLRLLKDAGAKAVILDLLFLRGANTDAANAELVAAAKAHGKVAVAAKPSFRVHNGEIIGSSIDRPFDELGEVAAWGISEAGDAS